MDEEAFRTLYERTARMLRAYLNRLTGSWDVADDLLQETYYRFLRVESAPEDETHRKNYLFRIATNLARDRFRRTKGTEVPLLEADAPTAGDQGLDLKADLHRTLSRLRPRDRELLWLAHVEGFSHKEIAEVLDLKTESIRLMVFRARKRLADLLREEGIGPEVLS